MVKRTAEPTATKVLTADQLPGTAAVGRVLKARQSVLNQFRERGEVGLSGLGDG